MRPCQSARISSVNSTAPCVPICQFPRAVQARQTVGLGSEGRKRQLEVHTAAFIKHQLCARTVRIECTKGLLFLARLKIKIPGRVVQVDLASFPALRKLLTFSSPSLLTLYKLGLEQALL